MTAIPIIEHAYTSEQDTSFSNAAAGKQEATHASTDLGKESQMIEFKIASISKQVIKKISEKQKKSVSDSRSINTKDS